MRRSVVVSSLIVVSLFISFLFPSQAVACSTFQFQKGNELFFGHNLNEPGMEVPGLVFINKRGILKHGRSFSELTSKNETNASNALWISQYGSVTFNNFGKDFIDGGINEVGLYIWEMNEDADYPQNKKLPKIVHMNWMQYVLDNYSTTEEVIQSASEFQIDGWTWHYFISDKDGNCASLEFLNGKIIVHKGATMPVQALFNMPYTREMELLKYYKGFGGQYSIDYTNSQVTRFAKTAKMLKDYNGENPTEYCINMLKVIKVYDVPDWTVLIDAKKRIVYFKTSINSELKSFSIDDIDFSNKTNCQILDINTKSGGNVIDRFVPFSNGLMKDFIDQLPIPEKGFLPKGSATVSEFKKRLTYHHEDALKPENQFFVGSWYCDRNNKDNVGWEIKLWMQGDAVMGEVIRTGDTVDVSKIDHFFLKNNLIIFTYISVKSKSLVEVKATFKDNKVLFEPFVDDVAFISYYLTKK